MTALSWEETPLSKHHDHAAFDCDDTDLNLYMQRYARQSHESGWRSARLTSIAPRAFLLRA
jgi:hypothetical protein